MQLEPTHVQNSCLKGRFLLSRAYASERSKLFANVSYQLIFYFETDSDHYRVDTTINFDLLTLQDIILECGVFLIQSLSINNYEPLSLTQIEAIWKDNALHIPKEYLSKGNNTIKLKTQSLFSRDSSGFHSYTHHSGGTQICYTVCPPNYAHLIYPCFDQPDIKATFELKVFAPSPWIVISNTPVLETKLTNEMFAGDFKLWHFTTTPKLSTYLFSIAAGNFREIRPKKPTQIPMRLYCGGYKYDFLVTQSEEFFNLIELGINFYQKFFGTPFPFEKYDQVFCPEFKYLGMENPGMVCLTENYIYMTQISDSKKAQRSLTILHELSHMWFGDFVTMKWWDDIWLNEGFASFIAHYTLPLISPNHPDNTIDTKFLFYKQEALNMDNLDSTHPVMQDVKDTEAATTIFNDITYCKGSAVIKHLMYMFGEENFSRALVTYFQRFRWSNADSRDFFNVIHEVLENNNKVSLINGLISEKENSVLSKWIKDWLETEGKLIIEYEVIPKDDCITINIFKEERPKRIISTKNLDLELAVFCLEKSKHITKIFNQRVCLKDAKTRVEIPLKKIDKKNLGVVLNYKDHAYSEIIMDNLSLDFFLKNSKYTDSLIKSQLFLSLMKKVELAQINPLQLFGWLEAEIPNEKNDYLASESLIYATKLMDYLLPEKLRAKCGKLLFTRLYSILTAYNKEMEPSKDELVLTIQEYIANFAYHDEDMLLLIAWMQRKNKAVSKLSVSGVLMGRIVEELFSRKLLIEPEREIIRTLYLKNHPYYINFVQGAESNFQTKLELWEKFVNFKPSDGSHFELSCLMKGINSSRDLNSEVIAKMFFEDLLKVFENNESEYSNIFFNNLFPKRSNPDFLIEKIQVIMSKIVNWDAYSNLRFLLEERLFQARICKSLEKFV